jgi:TM2 domain-containing membrane protein YozV
MARPKVDLKDPAFAALLAFLVPGLGHFYQRRVFKGLLYCVCILGTFFTGLSIGHGQVVYFQWKQPENRTYAYLCQFWVGIPALPALAQSQLRSKEAFDANFVSQNFSQTLEGTLYDNAGGESSAIGKLIGTIELKTQNPETPRHWIAKVTGTLTTPDGGSRPIEGEIVRGGGDRAGLDPEVAPWPRRRIIGRFEERGGEHVAGRLEGSMPRSLWDSFEAPLQDPRNDFGGEQSDLDRAHRELGGRFELGVVYTMIAGLLNILAIYDAFEGPAYEDEEDETQTDKPPPDPNVPPPA